MGDINAVVKAYDIRGRTDIGQIDAPLLFSIGRVFAEIAGGSPIAVGRDCRPSSPGLAEALIDGITDTGVDVLDLGEVATDVVYFISGIRRIPGVMVTASHNPSEYNGVKFCRAGASPVSTDTGLEEIRRRVDAGVGRGPGGGGVMPYDPTPSYVDHLFSIVDAATIAPLDVAVDGGNGMAGVVVESVFDRTAARLEGLYLEPDGTFPNHPADPLQPANLVDLVHLVQERGADLGVAFDGDADRAFFIDDLGVPVSGSTTTALIARWFLQSEPGASVVHNLITSRAVPEVIVAAGGTPVRTRVGHSYIKAVMAETGAVFGGEHSGHYYFRDNFRADSGMLAMLVLLRVMSDAGVPLSTLRREVEPYRASGEINIEVDDRSAAIEEVAVAFGHAPLDRLDGLTVDLGDSWFNLRPSNTEPFVRLNVEGPDDVTVDSLVAEVRGIVSAP